MTENMCMYFRLYECIFTLLLLNTLYKCNIYNDDTCIYNQNVHTAVAHAHLIAAVIMFYDRHHRCYYYCLLYNSLFIKLCRQKRMLIKHYMQIFQPEIHSKLLFFVVFHCHSIKEFYNTTKQNIKHK